ncbi:MAG TPA: ATP-dependent Clp protease proteolytic subunit [Chitinivibrionales bacterium]|jgi:ATP-dependent Clp protease protease subunit|nr:ATP-dependent Clp protease proteolytic subunit [Chitinivibrionales bacterium]
MNCFRHLQSPAVAICKRCGKGLCGECSAAAPDGMVCKEPCVSPNGRHAIFTFVNAVLRMVAAVLVIAAAILLATFVLQSRRQAASAESGEDEGLETRIEKGIYNAPPLDTLLFKQRKIYFSNDINELTCSWLAKQLLLLAGAGDTRDINLYLCSSGGNIADAKALCNVMRGLGARVNIYASGFCASSGVRILAAATGLRAAYGNTVFMFHGQDLRLSGKDHTYDAVAKDLDLEEWRSMTDIPESMILDTSEVYFSPQEALKYRVVDTIIALAKRQDRKEK